MENNKFSVGDVICDKSGSDLRGIILMSDSTYFISWNDKDNMSSQNIDVIDRDFIIEDQSNRNNKLNSILGDDKSINYDEFVSPYQDITDWVNKKTS